MDPPPPPQQQPGDQQQNDVHGLKNLLELKSRYAAPTPEMLPTGDLKNVCSKSNKKNFVHPYIFECGKRCSIMSTGQGSFLNIKLDSLNLGFGKN
jgi:hypothetical protein